MVMITKSKPFYFGVTVNSYKNAQTNATGRIVPGGNGFGTVSVQVRGVCSRGE
jgi:hypothetical protein